MTTLFAGTSIPVGSILAYGGETIPDGFLLCDGSLLNRNDFADLFAAIGTLWGFNTVLDFRLPTTQGMFLRGHANGSTNDPDRASRTAVATGGATGDNIGSLQNWRVQNHSHTTWFSQRNSNAPSGFVNAGGANTPSNAAYWYAGNSIGLGGYNGSYGNNGWGQSILINTYSHSGGASQTAPINVNVKYIIKY